MHNFREKQRLTRSDIEKTEAYSKLSKLQRKIYLTEQNIKAIRQGLTIASNIGIDKFLEEHNYNYVNKLIIKELIT